MGTPAMPPGLAHAMGAPLYLVRHHDERELLRLIALVHAPA